MPPTATINESSVSFNKSWGVLWTPKSPHKTYSGLLGLEWQFVVVKCAVGNQMSPCRRFGIVMFPFMSFKDLSGGDNRLSAVKRAIWKAHTGNIMCPPKDIRASEVPTQAKCQEEVGTCTQGDFCIFLFVQGIQVLSLSSWGEFGKE